MYNLLLLLTLIFFIYIYIYICRLKPKNNVISIIQKKPILIYKESKMNAMHLGVTDQKKKNMEQIRIFLTIDLVSNSNR